MVDYASGPQCLFRPIYKIALFAFVASVFVLGYVGAQPAEGIWPWVGLGLTGYYMAFFLVVSAAAQQA